MKFTAVALAALVTLVPSASAQFAVVQNNCPFTTYVQSVPYDGSTPGPLTTLAPGTAFQENYRASGSTVKMGTQAALAHPLFFGYSTSASPNLVYYELNNRFGNPFANQRVNLTSAATCGKFDCAPNNSSCYSSSSSSKVYSCPRPISVTATLCAPA